MSNKGFILKRPKLPKKVRLLVCGDREWKDDDLIFEVLLKLKYQGRIAVVIQGECRGADKIAKREAIRLFGEDKVLGFPANWTKYKRAAGPIRNQQMIDEGKPDFVLAFHDDFAKSTGTADMIKKAMKAGILYAILTHKNWQEFELP